AFPARAGAIDQDRKFGRPEQLVGYAAQYQSTNATPTVSCQRDQPSPFLKRRINQSLRHARPDNRRRRSGDLLIPQAPGDALEVGSSDLQLAGYEWVVVSGATKRLWNSTRSVGKRVHDLYQSELGAPEPPQYYGRYQDLFCERRPVEGYH